MRPFRILSLDGGGSWSVIQVMALQQIYGADALGHDVLKHFDLAAANSGGSIVLGGLLTNKPLSELRNFFMSEEKRASLFKRMEWKLDDWPKPFRTAWNVGISQLSSQSLGARYLTSAKFNGLSELLGPEGSKSLAEHSRQFQFYYGRDLQLLICGYDYDRRRAKFFRSNSASLAGGQQETRTGLHGLPRGSGKRQYTLAEVIHASTNAPLKYFVDPATFNVAGEDGNAEVERYWDGAIAGYNNPIMSAVVEVLANRPYNFAEAIQVLSLGTGTQHPVPRSAGKAESPALQQKEPQRPTLFGDLDELANSILDDPPDSATFIAHVVLGQPLPDDNADPVVRAPVSGTVVRMSPLIGPTRAFPTATWAVPDGLTMDEFVCLRDLDLDAVEQDKIALIEKLAKLWIEGKVFNQAIRENRDCDVQIGHRTFGEALTAWNALSEFLET